MKITLKWQITIRHNGQPAPGSHNWFAELPLHFTSEKINLPGMPEKGDLIPFAFDTQHDGQDIHWLGRSIPRLSKSNDESLIIYTWAKVTHKEWEPDLHKTGSFLPVVFMEEGSPKFVFSEKELPLLRKEVLEWVHALPAVRFHLD